MLGPTLLALALLALLDPRDLLARAKALPYGWQRTTAVDVASAIRTVSSAIFLDRPREALDELFGNDRTATKPRQGLHNTRVTPFRPSAQRPLRIYLGGDSVAQALTDSFRARLSGHKELTVDAEYRYATGLSRPDYFDCPERLRAVLARAHPPQVVIVMFGANDLQPIVTPTGPAATATAPWLAEYRRRVAAVMKLLSDAGVDVYWVGQPVMRDRKLAQRIDRIDDIYAAEAALHAGVRFIDTRPLFADAAGRYSAYLPGSDGRPVLMRAPDGVHLSAAGGARLTTAVLAAIAERWPLPRL